MAEAVSLSNAEDVVLEFAVAFTKWERDMAKAKDPFKDKVLQKRYKDILHGFCTDKKRVYVDDVTSFAQPPTYQKVVKENIESVEEATRTRIHVDTKNVGTCAYRFVLLKKADGWRIDSVKWRFTKDGKWENTLIGS